MNQLPTGSKSFQRLNKHLFRGDIGSQPDSSPLLDGRSVESRELPHCDELETPLEPRIAGKSRFVITGHIRGGKNHVIVTRKGKRIPMKSWAIWRDNAVMQVTTQMLFPFKKIVIPTNIRLTYFSGDKRKRDMPAVIDAIFHVLEKAGIVADDTLLWITESSRSYDKANPRAIIEFL